MVEGTTRAFLAVDLPGGLRSSAGELFNAWKRGLRDVRWVNESRLHLTVKFLGQIPSSSKEVIKETMSGLLGGLFPFKISLRGVGVFPSPEKPRVLFIGLDEGMANLASLMDAVNQAMSQIGFEPEKRKSAPHLTVGRVKYMRDRQSLTRWTIENRDVSLGAFKVDEVVLYKSELRPDGPVYSILDRYTIGFSPVCE